MFGASSSSMNSRLSIAEIVAATGAPEANVMRYWPEVWGALEDGGCGQKLVQVGAVATIATEVWSFKPIEEQADGSAYEHRADLGNTEDGDGRRYKGRGFIQLTGRANYRSYGERLGLDLLNKPESACEPTAAARILVAYFKGKGIPQACRLYQWKRVRRLVNGGLNGYERFIDVVEKLLI